MSGEAPVRLERSRGVAELVLDDPLRGNLIDTDWAGAFEAAVADLGGDDRCLLIRAEGANFCFGGDVGTFVGGDPGVVVRELADRLHVGMRRLDQVAIPVVAAVQGWATGAGMSLALAADVLVLGADARFKTAYNALGLTADGGMTWQLPRRLPATVAADLLFTDRVLDADEARQLGLASRVVPDDDLVNHARRVAASIAGRSRGAAIRVKRLLRTAPHATLSDQLDAEATTIAAAAASADGREGVAAFLERRPPRFGGDGA
jgi:2-(1,2-epoxy-1,2-dihydrophenyl)acetyl-CoA isomerase